MQNEGTATGFSYRNSTAGALGVFRFRGLNATGFLACPTRNGTAPWQVFADVEGLALRSPSVPGGNVSACLGFNALGVNFRGAGAWEYV